jgi:hypothetical protein
VAHVRTTTIQNHAAFIWSVADLLRGDYKLRENRLPVTVVPVTIYADQSGRRILDIEADHEPLVTAATTTASAPKAFSVEGRRVTLLDLLDPGAASRRRGGRVRSTPSRPATFGDHPGQRLIPTAGRLGAAIPITRRVARSGPRILRRMACLTRDPPRRN